MHLHNISSIWYRKYQFQSYWTMKCQIPFSKSKAFSSSPWLLMKFYTWIFFLTIISDTLRKWQLKVSRKGAPNAESSARLSSEILKNCQLQSHPYGKGCPLWCASRWSLSAQFQTETQNLFCKSLSKRSELGAVSLFRRLHGKQPEIPSILKT